MSTTLTPRLILETLLPHLKVAAAYARFLQPKIAALPAKESGGNFFAAALPPLDTCKEYSRSGLIVATSKEIHQHLLKATQNLFV